MTNNKRLFVRKFYKGELTASELIEVELDGDSYEGGRLEQAQAQAENTTEGLGRLVQVLFDKGLIDRADVWTVAGMNYMAEEEQRK